MNNPCSDTFKSVRLLKPRHQIWRLDLAPFVLLYAWAFSRFVLEAAAGSEVVLWAYLQLGGTLIVHVLLLLFMHWSASVRVAAIFLGTRKIADAKSILVHFNDFTMAKEVIALSRRTVEGNSTQAIETGFEARKQQYVFNANTEQFEPLSYPTQEPLAWYMRHTGYDGIKETATALAQWGPNVFDVPLPLFSTLLKEQLLAPFFVFQVFCVALWCMDEYWMYSIFTLFMLVFFECTVAGQRLRNLQHLRSLQTPKQLMMVYRNKKWDKIPGEYLVPGDIISIGSSTQVEDERVVPADSLLLVGTCIVDESVLTGESTPLWKSPLHSVLESGLSPDTLLDVKRDKAHILFGGTKVVQHTGDKSAHIKTPDGGCLAIVIQTGFETAQGRLMRTILYSTQTVTANNLETGLFILFLLIFAVSASAYVLFHGLNDPSRPRFKLFLTCSMIITSVIPPELPMQLSIAVNYSLQQLAKKRVYCTEPFRIPFAGKVDVCCFDKTGTLTDDSLVLQGVVLSAGKKVSESISPVASTPSNVLRVMASCHSLIVIDGNLAGDPLEKAAFEATKWSLSGNTVVSPRNHDQVSILHRFHFSPHLKRMSAVVRMQGPEGSDTAFVVTKGAPEVIEDRLMTKPDNYEAGYKKFASQGARVIAMAYRQLDLENENDKSIARGGNREMAESNLVFGGFAVFQCPLKPESEGALRMLKDSSHQLMMITGDTPLTACHTASKVHIVTREVLVLSPTASERLSRAQTAKGIMASDMCFEWLSPDETTAIPFSASRNELLKVASSWDLCVTGDALQYLVKRGAESFVIPMVQVFARVSPDQKELVVNTLRSQGRVTFMCGDGTNDVGGLKAAHVGVALLCPKQLIRDVNKKMSQKKTLAKKSATAKDRRVESHAIRPGIKKKLEGSSAQNLIAELERQGRPVHPAMRKMATMLEEAESMAHLPKPGDASMAAAFTAKQSSVVPCIDLLKQGRSTLVSTVQMFKILGLMSLSSAFSLSVMAFEGVKIGDVQATVSGLLIAAMFFFLSNSKPLDRLSTTRPHPNIFCFYVILSLFFQFGMHLFYLLYMYSAALETMPPKENQTFEQEFKPNLVNTICFLVNFMIQTITFAVNYAGHPFVTSIKENKPLYRSLMVSGGLWIILVLGAIPGLAELLEMVDIPFSLRGKICSLAVVDMSVTFGVEKLLRSLFPTPLPPEKGYMIYKKDLKLLVTEEKKTK